MNIKGTLNFGEIETGETEFYKRLIDFKFELCKNLETLENLIAEYEKNIL